MIVSDIIRIISNEMRIDPNDLVGPSKDRFFVRCRFALYMSLHKRGMSMKHIGRNVGGRDHSTIIYGLKRAEYIYERDEYFRHVVDKAVAFKTYRVQLRPEADDETRNLHIA